MGCEGNGAMTANGQAPRLAVLIDADNASARYARAIFEATARLGDATVRRIYGDFSNGRLKSWNAAIRTFAIVQHQQPDHVRGKNAADIALVIDAMDLMYRERLDGFCLVSSDSDFTRLAQRLRDGGFRVYGFGERKTPHAFRNACHRFAILGQAEFGTNARRNGQQKQAAREPKGPGSPPAEPKLPAAKRGRDADRDTGS